MLILDEATSAWTRVGGLYKKRCAFKADKTSSLRTSLSRCARRDKIVVMERGDRRDGTHRELLEKGGKYKRLYELQFADEEGFGCRHGGSPTERRLRP